MTATNDRAAYSRQEVATALGIAATSVDRLIATHQLVAVKVGRRVLVTRASLETFLNAQNEGGQE